MGLVASESALQVGDASVTGRGLAGSGIGEIIRRSLYTENLDL